VLDLIFKDTKMKRQIGNTPQHLSTQNEALLRAEIEKLKDMTDTLHSCIGSLRSAMHTLTDENKILVNDKAHLLSNIQDLEVRLKTSMQIIGELEGKVVALTHEKEVLIKHNQTLTDDAHIKTTLDFKSHTERDNLCYKEDFLFDENATQSAQENIWDSIIGSSARSDIFADTSLTGEDS
jgi:chromosome segregation ATPase